MSLQEKENLESRNLLEMLDCQLEGGERTQYCPICLKDTTHTMEYAELGKSPQYLIVALSRYDNYNDNIFKIEDIVDIPTEIELLFK